MDIQNIITIFGGVLSLGIVYGTVKSKQAQQDRRIDNLERHSDTIIEVKTKLDLLVTHFLNNRER